LEGFLFIGGLMKIILMILAMVLVGCTPAVSEDRTGVAEVEQEYRQVEMVIDFGEEEEMFEVEIMGEMSVMEVLEKGAGMNGLELEIKEFSFGKMVEKIGEVKSTNEKTWIYYVDGVAGSVGAGAMMVGGGEEVVWRYENVE
jgi:hypothetical protein